MFFIYAVNMLLDLDSLQSTERDDRATIHQLQLEVAKKSEEMDLMKRKDFDTLRKQNESISQIQRKFDDLAHESKEQIQALTVELSRYKQSETLGAAVDHEVTTTEQDYLNRDDVEATDNEIESAGISKMQEKAIEVSEHEDVDADEFKFDAIDLQGNRAPYVSTEHHKQLFFIVQVVTMLCL